LRQADLEANAAAQKCHSVSLWPGLREMPHRDGARAAFWAEIV
jgi:hypothetical protein